MGQIIINSGLFGSSIDITANSAIIINTTKSTMLNFPNSLFPIMRKVIKMTIYKKMVLKITVAINKSPFNIFSMSRAKGKNVDICENDLIKKYQKITLILISILFMSKHE